mgnify:CR=1 FL=1
MLSDRTPGTNERIGNRLLGNPKAFGDFLLLKGFPIIELNHLLLTGSQEVGIFEKNIDGPDSHVEAREIF